MSKRLTLVVLCLMALVACDRSKPSGQSQYQDLVQAARENRPETIKSLIESGIAPDQLNEEGYSALMAAAYSGNHDATAALLQAGSTIDFTDAKGRTALMYALSNSQGATARHLVERGASLEFRDHKGNTPLHYAIRMNELEFFDYALTSKRASPRLANDAGISLLMFAGRYGNSETIYQLLDLGADPNRHDDDGETALYHAVKHNRLDTITPLLINTSGHGLNEMLSFSRVGNSQAVALLLDHVDVDARVNGETALMAAAYNNRPEVVQLLLANGADIEMQSANGETPLAMAALQDNEAAMEVLLQHGADTGVLARHSALNRTPAQATEKQPGPGASHLAIKTPETEVLSCQFSPDGRWIAASGYRRIHLYDAQSGRLARTLDIDQQSKVSQLAFVGDDHLLFAAGNSLGLFDLTTGGTTYTRSLNVPVGELAFEPKSRHAAVKTASGIDIVDAMSGKTKHTVAFYDSIRAMAFARAGGKLLVNAEWGNSIEVFDVASGRLDRSLKGTPRADAIAVLPGGAAFLTLSMPWTLNRISFDGQLLGTLQIQGAIDELAIGPKGEFAAIGTWLASDEEFVHLYDLARNVVAKSFGPFDAPMHEVAFSSDGQSVLACFKDKTVRVWHEL